MCFFFMCFFRSLVKQLILDFFLTCWAPGASRPRNPFQDLLRDGKSTPKPPFGAPREKMFTKQKREPDKLLGWFFGIKNGTLNGPFSATKRLVYCLFSYLFRTSGRKARMTPVNGQRHLNSEAPKPDPPQSTTPPEKYEKCQEDHAPRSWKV